MFAYCKVTGGVARRPGTRSPKQSDEGLSSGLSHLETNSKVDNEIKSP